LYFLGCSYWDEEKKIEEAENGMEGEE